MKQPRKSNFLLVASRKLPNLLVRISRFDSKRFHPIACHSGLGVLLQKTTARHRGGQRNIFCHTSVKEQSFSFSVLAEQSEALFQLPGGSATGGLFFENMHLAGLECIE